jgi:multicomponent Na+:H+ antiporter subunit E
MRSILGLLILLIAVWAVLSWHYSTEPLIFVFAVLSLLAVVWLTRRMDRVAGGGSLPASFAGMLLRLPRYTLFVARWLVDANIRVTRLLLDPRIRLKPRVLRIKASQKTELGRVILANSITLTPGTVTLDVDGDELLVFALGPVSASGVLNGEMDREVSRLEGSLR